jgi:hypothetical protein
MDVNPDDLPPGMTGGSNWELLVEALRTWRAVPGRHSPRALGVAMKGDPLDEQLQEQRRERARNESRKFYAKMKKDPVWLEKRRAYYRAKYHAARNREK